MADRTNVLIAVDSTEASTDAIHTAYRLFGPTARYIVANIAPGPAPLIPPAPDGDLPDYMSLSNRLSRAKAGAHEIAEVAEDMLATDADIEVALGDVGPELARMAQEQHTDVIVLGSHDRSIWDRLFNPHTGRCLIENAPCPVLVVR